jgi:hypothetical protein
MRGKIRDAVPHRIETLGDVVVLVPDAYQDDRGFFMEAFRADQFRVLGFCRAIFLRIISAAPDVVLSAVCTFNGILPWASSCA